MYRLEGAHLIFLRQVTQKQERQRRDGSRHKVTEEAVLQGAGTQSLRTYVDRRQATVAEWVALRPIFDVSVRETGYEGGGRLLVPWWRQEAAENQLKVAVEAISAAARVRWRQGSGRRGGSEGGSEGGSKDSEGWGRGREHPYAGTETGDAQVGR